MTFLLPLIARLQVVPQHLPAVLRAGTSTETVVRSCNFPVLTQHIAGGRQRESPPRFVLLYLPTRMLCYLRY